MRDIRSSIVDDRRDHSVQLKIVQANAEVCLANEYSDVLLRLSLPMKRAFGSPMGPLIRDVQATFSWPVPCELSTFACLIVELNLRVLLGETRLLRPEGAQHWPLLVR